MQYQKPLLARDTAGPYLRTKKTKTQARPNDRKSTLKTPSPITNGPHKKVQGIQIHRVHRGSFDPRGQVGKVLPGVQVGVEVDA